MQIKINGEYVEAASGETILEMARRTGHAIPSLCYAKGAQHQASCMVCAVREASAGQVIPSCTTYPAEGMQIETDSEEVRQVRTLSLELLLSDHRADCEAPCSMVCPEGLDVERMLGFYDNGRRQDALAVLEAAFALPRLGCDACKAPCEKACRRGSVDKAVPIREIVREVAALYPSGRAERPTERQEADQALFHSRLGRFTAQERERLKETVGTPSGCLHCACAGRGSCQLRELATSGKIRRPRYGSSSALAALEKVHVRGNMWFEPAKCIRCGLCVYNSDNGFTFKGRGFGMQVVIPEENRENAGEELAELCPTGAIYLIES